MKFDDKNARPTALDVLFDNIPQELRELKQWVYWRWDWIYTRAAWSKPPYLTSNQRADISNSGNFYSFDVIRNYLDYGFDGIGFVLLDSDNYIGIDFDDCIDLKTRGYKDWIKPFLEIASTYAEISPSGSGIKMFFNLNSDFEISQHVYASDEGRVELYQRRRYFTITGQRLDGFDQNISDSADDFEKLYELINQTFTDKVGTKDSSNPLYDKISSSVHGDKFHKLLAGDLSDFNGDWSRADLSLCWLFARYGQNDFAEIDAHFRKSALYREKWEREDYRCSTIDKAMNAVKTASSVKKKFTKKEDSSLKLNFEFDGHGLPYSDTWNALFFHAHHGEDFLWVDDLQRWFFWSGVCWEMDLTLEVKRAFNNLMKRAFFTQLRQGIGSKSELFKHLSSSLSISKLNSGLEALKVILAEDASIFDGKYDLLNTENGVLNLKTGELRPPNRQDYFAQIVKASYDDSLESSEWHSFLQQVQPNSEMRGFLQRAVGYSLTGHDNEQCLFYLLGYGSNGKTTFIESIRHMLNSYSVRAPAQMLQQDSFGTNNDYAVPELRNKRMVVHTEVVASKKLDEGLVKDLTGSEGLVGRRAYAREYERFESVSKHWLYGNHLLNIAGTDEGIWRRIMLVEFSEHVSNPDRTLLFRLKSEKEQSAILFWALQGAMSWYDKGLAPPEGVIKATNSYRRIQDDVGAFLEQFTTAEEGLFASSADLWELYNESFNGDLSRRQFSQALVHRLGESKSERTPEGIRRGWGGIGLV